MGIMVTLSRILAVLVVACLTHTVVNLKLEVAQLKKIESNKGRARAQYPARTGKKGAWPVQGPPQILPRLAFLPVPA